MEIAIALVVGLLVFSLFVMGHPTSVIARKTDQSDTAEVLAWIPILQFAPLVWAAGAQLRQVVTMTIGVLLAAFLLGFAGGALGEDGLGAVLTSVAGWAGDLYFFGLSCWIGWRVAERRALPPAFGLLLALPLLNILATWVLAFHDGWERPHRGGLAAAAVLSLALILPGIYVAKHLDEETLEEMRVAFEEAVVAEQRAELEALEAQGQDGPETLAAQQAAALPPSGVPDSGGAAQQDDRTIRALFEVTGRFEKLDSLTAPENLRVHDHRVRALALVRNIRTELQALNGDLDAATYEELAHHLNRVEAEIEFASNPNARRGGSLTLGAKKPTPSRGAALPAAPAPGASGAPSRPFAVRVAEDCPTGTELRSREGEKGDEEWCQQLAQYGGLRHGWYARYFEGGKPEQVGEYRDGLRVGVWTRFYPSGAVRAQAEFDAGLQHGWLLTFTESGERKKAVRFDAGTAFR
ncbi:MAG: hypothetical protein AAGC67_00275 [Myxococcota bacterium]